MLCVLRFKADGAAIEGGVKTPHSFSSSCESLLLDLVCRNFRDEEEKTTPLCVLVFNSSRKARSVPIS
jgi:hypothetical protein